MPTMVAQTVHFDAAVDRVYAAIADSREHSAFTGAPAELASHVGGPFTTHGGAIEGRMLEVVPNERIVQAWRSGDWPDGVFSIVRYDFAPDDDGTRISLEHTGLPEDASAHIADGWRQRYWEPLETYLAAGR